MNRIFSLALILVFLLSSIPTAHADDFSYRKSDLNTALQQMEVSAFSSEFGWDGRDYTVRWQVPLSVYFFGDYTDRDLAFFFRFITELTEKVPGLPEIHLTTDKDASNVQICYTTLDQMSESVFNYTEGNWGYFSFWNTDSSISRLEIAVAADVTNQIQRNHIIMEEFVGGLGLANDHYIDEKSILYGEWTQTQTLTNADWLTLRILYDERFDAGLKWNELKPLIEQYY